MFFRLTDQALRLGAIAAVAAATCIGSGARAADPDFLTIGGGPSGGTFNIVATGLANVLKKEFPKSIITVEPGGSGPNILRVSNGQVDLGITSANNAWDAWHGKDPAKADHPIRDIRGLMTFFPSAIQIWVPADSNIHSVTDLAGKQISAGQPGQTSWLAFKNLLKVYGMSIKDIESGGGKLHKLSWSESQAGLRDGKLDAVFWVSLYPHPSVIETATSRPIRVLSLDQDKIESYLKKYGGGFQEVTLPAGLYPGMKKPAKTVGTKTFLFANKKMPKEIAYRVDKAIWDNLSEFKSTHALLKYMSPKTVGKGMVVPLHPGARKFFDEQGIPYTTSKLQ